MHVITRMYTYMYKLYRKTLLKLDMENSEYSTLYSDGPPEFDASCTSQPQVQLKLQAAAAWLQLYSWPRPHLPGVRYRVPYSYRAGTQLVPVPKFNCVRAQLYPLQDRRGCVHDSHSARHGMRHGARRAMHAQGHAQGAQTYLCRQL